jgi:branched-chain amino acid transport system ATP-binding protein
VALLAIRGVTEGFGGPTAVSAVELDVEPGERLAIVGPNGAGLTALFLPITSFHAAAGGTICLIATAHLAP